MNMILIAALTSIMFLGGWLSPFNVAPFTSVTGSLWLAPRSFVLLFIFLWIRATFPRYRYDQIMRLGWKVFIPVTLGLDRVTRRDDAVRGWVPTL